MELPRIRVNGVELAYLDRGGGRPILFVHGWCCDHTYLAPQIDHFAARGYRAVAVDLRGHGASKVVAGPYTMAAFADDVAALCAALALERPVLVGHSMGGIVAFDCAARYPALAAAIVMIDAAVVVPAAARRAMAPFIAGLNGPGYRELMTGFVGSALFIPADDAARRQRILAAMARTPQAVMAAAFAGLRDYDPDEAGARIGVPSLYIAAAEPAQRSDMERLKTLAPSMQVGRVVGAGHFCQLEVPEQVNAMIARFLAVSELG